MANATSPLNTNSKDLDPLVLVAGTSSLRRGVAAIAAAGIGDTIANQGVATDVDDAAFTVGASPIVVAGALADETATDSVDEGDAGALRMTLNRRLITAGQFLDDSAFGVATDYVSPIAALADETATDSVDEGDIGAVRMTLDRRLHVAVAAYNGTSWDALRNNVEATLLASAVRAGTTASADQTNHNGRTALIVFDITAVPGIDTVTLTIQGKDPISGTYYTILAGAAQVATGTIIMQVGQAGLTAVPNLVANNLLPRTWRVNVVHSAASNFTYSVSASVGV